MGVRDHTGQWLQFVHWNQKMDEKQKWARSLMDQIIPLIIEQNEQVSSRLIISRIVYDLIAKAIWFPKDYPDFALSAKQEINSLIDYKASRSISTPLSYLITKNSLIKFGFITICNIMDTDRENEWWKKIIGSGGNSESVRAYARVDSKGDLEKSLQGSRVIVNDMLLFLRAMTFPITAKSQHQFGLLNEHPSILSLPFRIDSFKENYKLEFPVQYSTSIGPGIFSYEVERDLLDQIDKESLEKLNKIIEDDYINPSSDLK